MSNLPINAPMCSKCGKTDEFSTSTGKCIFHCEKDDWEYLGENEKFFWERVREKMKNEINKNYEIHDFSSFIFPEYETSQETFRESTTVGKNEQQEFEQWNTQKQKIHLYKKRKHPKQGEIWICEMGKNIGSEQNKARPVLVINKQLPKENTCVIIPASSTKRNFSIEVEGYNFLPHQIRNIDTKRLKRNITRISRKSVQKVLEKFLEFQSIK